MKVKHHTKYKEIDGIDEVVIIEQSLHTKIHKNTVKIPRKISKAAECRAQRETGYFTKWEQLNKDKVNRTCKKWRDSHKEQDKITQQRWKDENKEKLSKYRKQYYKEKGK